MLDDKSIIVIDENNNEIEMEILFTFEDENFNKNYVLYVDPNDESGEVFVSVYDESGTLSEITDEKEWEMIEEVFDAFIIKNAEDADA